MKIRVMVAALGFVGGLPLISTNLFAQEVPPTRVPVGPPVRFRPGNYSLPHAAVPAVRPQSAANGGVQISFSYDGIDFNDSNCDCLPPDTNAAVSNSFVVETVNVQLRVFGKNTGIVLLDEPLATLFGAPSGGDPYVVYDDIADRWYISAFDSNDSGLFLAVSADGNPLHGFQTFHLTNVGGFPDYAKPGFNEDAIFISYNDFGSNGGNAAIASIDKAAALSGTLTYFVSHPKSQFRAMPPAQMHGDNNDGMHGDNNGGMHGDDNGGMHGDNKGGVEWFVSTDGTDAGGNTIRVTEMTNYLSNTPNFTYTSLPVTQYQYAQKADQPGGNITVFPNTTTTQVHYHLGRLVTAMASATASDGFVYPKGLYYQINVNGGRPRLLKQGVIDPGPGVAVQMPSVVEDQQGNLGVTWMESSSSEYLSMWVANLYTNGTLSTQPVAPGGGFFFVSFRMGDYSTAVLDPSDNRTFWAANEYIGPNGGSDIWRTHITSFSAKRVPQHRR